MMQQHQSLPEKDEGNDDRQPGNDNLDGTGHARPLAGPGHDSLEPHRGAWTPSAAGHGHHCRRRHRRPNGGPIGCHGSEPADRALTGLAAGLRGHHGGLSRHAFPQGDDAEKRCRRRLPLLGRARIRPSFDR
ncbi:hypothetical protein DESC_600007 [Desulfosarcina cetonica]|nr:hypothetical protein DESC_600007 [Desulfosarcina cetonica]